MKRNDLLRELKVRGFYFLRSGGSHDIYTNGVKKIAVPRHREIKDSLAKAIIKDAES